MWLWVVQFIVRKKFLIEKKIINNNQRLTGEACVTVNSELFPSGIRLAISLIKMFEINGRR